MSLNKDIKDFFKSEDKAQNRYLAARFLFVVFAFVFFLNYYFVGIGYYENTSVPMLKYSLFMFVLSLFFFVLNMVSVALMNQISKYIIYVISCIIFVAVLISIYVPSKILLNIFN